MRKIRMLRSLVGLSKLGRTMRKKGVKPNKLPKEAKHMKSYIERHTPGRERIYGEDYLQARAKAYYRSSMAPGRSYFEGSSIVPGRPVSQANVTGRMIKDMRKAAKHTDKRKKRMKRRKRRS